MSFPVYYVIEDDTLPHLFSTFDSNGGSVTMTGLAVTDIEIYKDGGTTQRSSDAGYTLLDTDGIDFDSLTGIHGFSIDLSDNTDAGFYAVGSWYHVVVSAITVDSQTVSFVACAFRILDATRGMSGTALPDAAAGAAGGLPTDSTGKTAFNDLSAAQVNTECDTALTDYDPPTKTEMDSAFTEIKGATWASGTDTLEAIRDRGDAAWITGAGTGLTALASGTAQGGSSTTIQLASAETFADDELIGNIVKITSGTGAGQSRLINDYTGATDTATVNRSWTTNPDATSDYEVVSGLYVVEVGVSQTYTNDSSAATEDVTIT